ncbi:MAG: EAL domain-containing protein [Sulfurimonas sp.]|nr:EAL domain-containing protein [Sulfurimonas sp.]
MSKLFNNIFTVPIALTILLIILKFNFIYLVFHTFAEYFAVFVSFSITLVSYYTFRFTKNRYLLFIGLGYFWIAILDILHTQTYPGMNLYDITTANTTLTFWVLTRVFEASILLTAPFMRHINFSTLKISFSLGILTLGITFLAFLSPLELFITGEGLTNLKINLEYLIVFMLLITLYINRQYIKEFNKTINYAVSLSIILTILSELSFTFYTDMYGVINFVGHILKFLSFWVILQAIIKTSLSEPFSLMQKGASTYNNIPVPAVVVDERGIIRQVNQAALSFIAKDESDIIGKSNHTILHPKNLSYNKCPICQAIKAQEYIKEYEIKDTQRNTFTEYSLSPINYKDDEAIGVVQISVDTTQKRKLQRAMTNQYKLLQNIVNTVPIRIFWKDYDGKYLGANNLFLEDAKLKSEDDIIGKDDFEMVWGETEGQLYRDDDLEVMNTDTPKLHFEELQTNDEGNTTVLSTSKVPLKDVEGRIIGLLGTYEDITNRRNMENKIIEQSETLKHQATHDALTLLPNRLLFTDRLENTILKAKRNSNEFAVLFLDLDQFKQINDSLGHHIGDEILVTIAKRLKKTIREGDTLARLGGDEFTIIIDNYKSLSIISTLSQKIIDCTTQVIEIKDHKLYVTSSIGISLYPRDSEDAQNLLKFADAAMYKAKDEGRNNFQFYSDDMTKKAMQRVTMQTNLSEAIKEENFKVYYQPQIDTKTNTVSGLEALVRWQDKDGNFIPPSEFIPLAEETGMIIELDRVVMKKALSQLEIWRREDVFNGTLSLNLAMKQLQRDDFVEFITDTLKDKNYSAGSIELEVTESGLMQKADESIERLNTLKSLGIKISIDDFGTGYSSLAYIKKLPISKIKIDRSFVSDIPEDKDDVSIVKAIIALAKSLELEILAEGVETKEQNEFMIEHDCHLIQGYYHAKPMSSSDTEKFLKSF